MKKIKGKYTERVSFAVTPAQWKILIDGHANSVYVSFSEHVRAMIFHRKMHIYYRNQSFDDFLMEAIRLRQLMQTLLDGGTFTERDATLVGLMDQIKVIMNNIFDHVRKSQ